MRIVSLVAAVGLLTFFAPAPSGAQSLAEAAAKEKARRKALQPSKVYTDDDLRRAGASAQPQTSVTPTDAASPAPAEGSETKADAKDGSKPKTDDEIRAEHEKDWRDRLTKANAEVARLNTEIASIEAAVGDIRQNLYSTARATQLARLDEDKKQLATAQQSVTDLQEEGRRNRYTP